MPYSQFDEVNSLNKRTLVWLAGAWGLIAVGTAIAHASPQAKLETPAMRQWEALSPQISPALIRGGESCPKAMQIEIIDAADVTGDGQPEALVDFCQGGAYTDWIVLMQLHDGKPVLATFRDVTGKLLEGREFGQGSSVMHSVDVQLVPAEHAVYNIVIDQPNEDDPGSCKVTAYVWNPTLKSFVENVRATKRAKRSTCLIS